MTTNGPNRTAPTSTVALLAFEGCQGSAIGSVIEVLDISIAVSGAPAEIPAPDLIFIPGLHFTGDTVHFCEQVNTVAERCRSWLVEQQRSGRAVAASCAGNLRQALSVEQLASTLNTTPRTLNRHFHDALSCSPKQYIQELRVEGAKRLLESTDLSYEEIVARVGQEDPRAFRRVFERLTRVSPGKYRRMFAIHRH